MSAVVTIAENGSTGRRTLRAPESLSKPVSPLRSRTAYAAAHVVPRVTGDNTPGAPADIDWDATLGFRRHLWSWGLGVADAMDTAQRNMGLDPAATRELVARSAAAAKEAGGSLVVGVSTDHVQDEVISLSRVVDAYVEQLHHAEDQGAGVVLMASRHLVRAAETAADYERVYRGVLARAGAPVVLHWLGPDFDPVLSGYFGATDPAAAMDTVVRIMSDNRSSVRGIKMSLLDAGHERALRARLPAETTMFTGDDYNYVDLIAGDGERHSDALLGAFALVAPQASAAIRALDAEQPETYRRVLGPTEALARHVFSAPTYHYKTGVAFLAWLNGHQPGFTMVGGLHSARSLPHLSGLIELADAAGALEDPGLAAHRWHACLATFGIDTQGVTRP
ncbi:dihydrodipicolinate synthase family protein [Streptomyces fuscigenes]|uniref:dihydrodipicolinate synthase family protein n=1 Tax=Streptomyces fuscigenes TaxID=1528880 RepID=UPI001F2E3980|nr:dihydrodipicolinate synthase family protein [Streptomyces fuscigenes]MCF3961144.1 dihydrodipicolinate synthase family protein [Streptomyces fuscigenes]